MLKYVDFSYSQEICLLDTCSTYWTQCTIAAFKKVVHKTVEATIGLIGNKIAEKIVKPKAVPETNSRNVKEIVIPPEKIQSSQAN